MDDKAQSSAVRAAFRQSLQGGTVMLTSGIIALGGDVQDRILAAVTTFDAFNANNDPWAEHDFGSFEIDGGTIFFKLDYYNPTGSMYSEDPTDPSGTKCVLTITLASEY